MKFKSFLTVTLFIFTISLLFTSQSYAGIEGPIPESDNDQDNFALTAFFDLRERESFVQITNTDSVPQLMHVQIFNVAQNCNENNFFDNYTINDTHVYNLRDILTNDTNPSGVVLPDNSYGLVIVTPVDPVEFDFQSGALIGNFRVLDNNGYEYRTNMSGWNDDNPFPEPINQQLTFNYSKSSGITLSDVVGIYVISDGEGVREWRADSITRTFTVMDVDIFDLNENPLSCRDVAFACVQPDSSFVDEILAYDGGEGGSFEGENGANAASFEYGINEAVPHSKNGELLCPGNNIEDGIVILNIQGIALPDSSNGSFILNVFIGLNNGNGRGSMDAVWWEHAILDT